MDPLKFSLIFLTGHCKAVDELNGWMVKNMAVVKDFNSINIFIYSFIHSFIDDESIIVAY